MATVELSRGGADDLGGAPDRARRKLHLASALLGALLLLLLYAAFSHGGVGLPIEARAQVVLDALTALAAAAWLWGGGLRVAAPRAGLAAVGLLAAFAVWCGITLWWSITPNQTWLGLNRALAYVFALLLAIAVGASQPRAPELMAKGFFAVALAVTVYALGQKIVPGLHLAGVFDLNQTTISPRLRAPLYYWNALALLIAFAVPIGLALATDEARSERARLGALAAIEVMLLTIGLTYSRGGVIALVLALVVAIGSGGARMRSLTLLAAACAAALPALIFGLTNHALTRTGVPLGDRETAGGELAALLFASLVLLWGVARVLVRLEPRLRPNPTHALRNRRLVAGLAVVALAGTLVALALSPRGLTGTISHEWKSFSTPHGTSVYDSSRLLSANSGNRWVWWKEAAGAFSDRPLGGWGAGSFPALHLLYRRDTLPVLQPHSVPLQLLAETGLVGALLVLGAFGLLLAAGTEAVRRSRPGQSRRLAAALLAAGAAYALHALYDWDWNFPAVTLPALMFLGVLAGARRPPPAPPRGPQVVTSLPRARASARALAVLASSAVLAVVALSDVLPSLARSKAQDALVAAASPAPNALRDALAAADLATRLDPLADDGLKAAATISLRRGQPLRARGYLLDAVRRDPTDVQAWSQLADVELVLGDTAGLVRAADRALALDPRGTGARALAAEAHEFTTPPNESATATGTPLPGG